MNSRSIIGLTIQELEQVLRGWKQEAFRAKQIFSWVYKKGITDFARMSDLPRDLRKSLEENFYLFDLKLVKVLRSKDRTAKFLLEAEDKSRIEAVAIPAEKRLTGCISTQIGCKFSCAFCASGISGFKRNLTVAEMVSEALFLKNNSAQQKLTHLVFMGTGEPLDNYENVLKAIRLVNSPETFHIGARRITISTCGIIPGMKKLAGEGLQVELSISLHAADDKTRGRLMPVNKKYPLKELIAAAKGYSEKTGRQITFEYVLIKGVNSDLQNALNLVKILKGMKLAKVNLIPANPVKELALEPPAKKDILLFRDYLLKQGVNVTLRMPRGEDIAAACGQLRLRDEKIYHS
ncbi:MAG: 23S rRNA (adenine(2503)-C(2))-methyltransferase RlmN [Candidatus Omnitrophota bacterium]|jgi:23S rRNA (adenine2503-C2)-methyltransferase